MTTAKLYLGEEKIEIDVEQVKLTQGYDDRGTYFGVGERLWRCDHATGVYYVRAALKRDAIREGERHFRLRLKMFPV